MTWKPTMELRFRQTYYSKSDSTTGSYKILQQKHLEVGKYAVSNGPGATARVEERETGAVAWLDVPLVDEEDSDDRAD